MNVPVHLDVRSYPGHSSSIRFVLSTEMYQFLPAFLGFQEADGYILATFSKGEQ